MKKLIAVLLMVVASVALATPGATISRVNLRAGPSTSSRIVTVLAAGSHLEVGKCSASWCIVSAGTHEGYVARSYLRIGAPMAAPVAPVVQEVVPYGASAICADGTYSFSVHRRGTCSHHGGVAQWL